MNETGHKDLWSQFILYSSRTQSDRSSPALYSLFWVLHPGKLNDNGVSTVALVKRTFELDALLAVLTLKEGFKAVLEICMLQNFTKTPTWRESVQSTNCDPWSLGIATSRDNIAVVFYLM